LIIFLNFDHFPQGGQWKQALELFEEMKAMGVPADTITYSALISACEKGEGMFDLSLSVVRNPNTLAHTLGALHRRSGGASDVYSETYGARPISNEKELVLN
jgi:hypothetical protein